MKKKILVALAVGFLVIGMVGMANAVVLTFDDHPDVLQNDAGPIGSYGGFDFGSTNSHNRMDWSDTVNSVWSYGSVSGAFTMLNNYGGSAIITSSTALDFTFNGLWARVWGEDPNRSVYIEGFNDGASVLTLPFTLTQDWQFVSGSPVTIDELHIDFGNSFLVDNLGLNENGPDQNPVPEPSTIILLGFGLVGLAGVARKKMLK